MSDCFENSHPKEYLTNLPTEIICRIVCFCSILDVIAGIRGCCKELRSISHDRSVWLALLIQLGNQVAIPVEFSFPLSTLTSAHLERLTTSHLHFRQIILSYVPSNTQKRLVGFRSRRIANLHHDVVQYKSSRDIPLSPDVRRGCVDVYLFPGGRYLLTVNVQLQLWDLGSENTDTPHCLTSTLLQPAAGAKVGPPPTKVHIRDLSFREGKYSFLVLVSDHASDDDSADALTVVYRYTIVPNCTSPIFVLDSPPIITHTHFSTSCVYYDGRNLVAFLFTDKLSICHFGLPMRLSIPLPREINVDLRAHHTNS